MPSYFRFRRHKLQISDHRIGDTLMFSAVQKFHTVDAQILLLSESTVGRQRSQRRADTPRSRVEPSIPMTTVECGIIPLFLSSIIEKFLAPSDSLGQVP